MSLYRPSQFVPPSVFNRFRMDPELSEAQRQALADTLQLDAAFRRVRDESSRLTRVALAIAEPPVSAPSPQIAMFDCRTNAALPGVRVDDPAASADPTARAVFDETTQFAAFLQDVFARPSIVLTVVASIHFGRDYSNAMWTGSQMAFGDGDGEIFVDFTRGQDVIAHELAHGVIQHSAQLNYVNEAGALNESLSDCFGAMFKQWRRGETSAEADWLIGADILGPTALGRGFNCLRDMGDPTADHCLSPQVTQYSQYRMAMDPHVSSGIANLAFHSACVAAGGHSWDQVGPVWYRAMAGFAPDPNLKMREFADRTRTVAEDLFPGDETPAAAIDGGWKEVGL